MINILDYFFYRTYGFYEKYGETFPEIAATGFLSCCLMLNVLSILPIIMNISANNWLVIIVWFSLQIFTANYFSKKRRVKLDLKWKNETISKKRIRGFMIIGYIIGTIAFFIYSLRLYAGYNNWKWEF